MTMSNRPPRPIKYVCPDTLEQCSSKWCQTFGCSNLDGPDNIKNRKETDNANAKIS